MENIDKALIAIILECCFVIGCVVVIGMVEHHTNNNTTIENSSKSNIVPVVTNTNVRSTEDEDSQGSSGETSADEVSEEAVSCGAGEE
jgi:hypothetical protein